MPQTLASVTTTTIKLAYSAYTNFQNFPRFQGPKTGFPKYTSRYSNGLLPFKLSSQLPLPLLTRFHSLYDHNKTWGKATSYEAPHYALFSCPLYFLPLKSKYSPHHHALKHLLPPPPQSV
jgi:hypothetical protein